MPDKTSLRALIQDRKAKQSRPIHRHLFTLDPELYADRAEIEQQLDDLPDEPPAPPLDGAQKPRLNGAGPRQQLEKRLADLDELIAAHSVTAVFKALTADQMGSKIAAWEKAKLETLDQARDLIEVCFDRFDTDEDLGRADLLDLLPTLTQGETFALSNELSVLAQGDIDIPKSVRQSMAARRTAATSRPA